MFGIAFQVIFIIMASVLNGAGRERISMILAIFGLVASAILNYALIPVYGIMGAAIASTAASLMIMLASAYFVYTRFRRLMNPVSAIKIAIAAVAAYIFLKALPMSIFIAYPAAAIIYAAMLLAMKEITKEEIMRYIH